MFVVSMVDVGSNCACIIAIKSCIVNKSELIVC
jgi:hypothetical protein